MNKEIVIYHGSQQIVKEPKFGYGKKYNDYGVGFYCTENIELAKEWACPIKNDGYANKYLLHIEGLRMMHLTRGEFNILNWLAILLANRSFDITSPVGKSARKYIIDNFLPDTSGVDIIIGYRADDSYFSFAEDFINNTISVRDLNEAMRLGKLGEQIVLISERAHEKIEFLGYELADYREYYFKRAERDKAARTKYSENKRELEQLLDDIFIIDIIREAMKQDDPRLQSVISE